MSHPALAPPPSAGRIIEAFARHERQTDGPIRRNGVQINLDYPAAARLLKLLRLAKTQMDTGEDNNALQVCLEQALRRQPE